MDNQNREHRLTARNKQGGAYFPRCFEGPCEGFGCRFDRCDFWDAVCERLALYEENEAKKEKVCDKSQ